MIDQNTDRSYMMIGAVLVAAAIIAGALYVFRDMLFAKDTGVIPKLIDSIFTKASKKVGEIE